MSIRPPSEGEKWEIYSHPMKEGDMVQEEKNRVVLRVNGAEVEINSFVQGLFENIIFGVLSSLRLDNEPETVELRITRS